MRQEGKTLMELMVIVAILGIVAALGTSSFLALNSRMQTRCVIEEIASELRLARQLAIAHRDRVRVVFDIDQQIMTAHFVNGATLNRAYRYGDKGIGIDEPSAGPDILFHPSGRSATATTILLHGSEGQLHRLTVSLTGRVSIL